LNLIDFNGIGGIIRSYYTHNCIFLDDIWDDVDNPKMLLVTKFIAVLDITKKNLSCKAACTPVVEIYYEVIEALEPGETEIKKHYNCVLFDGKCALLEALNDKTALAANLSTIEFEEKALDRYGSLKLQFILYNRDGKGLAKLG
jgi:hypothetical protein